MTGEVKEAYVCTGAVKCGGNREFGGEEGTGGGVVGGERGKEGG